MGGFEGGDEGGYWDLDEPTIFSKANRSKSFIKKSGPEYTLKVFIKEQELYDSISLVPCKCDDFTIESYDKTLSEIISKTYKALLEYTNDSEIEEFFNEYKVLILRDSSLETEKQQDISHAEAFLHLTKEACNLILRNDELELLTPP